MSRPWFCAGYFLLGRSPPSFQSAESWFILGVLELVGRGSTLFGFTSCALGSFAPEPLEDSEFDVLLSCFCDMNNPGIEENNRNNADLVYQYTLQVIKEQNDSIIRLDSKISALLAFSGLILRFSEIKIEHRIIGQNILIPEITYVALKLIACILALICVTICIYALKGISRGVIIEPSDLLEDGLFDRKVESNKCAIVKSLIPVKDEYYEIGKNKQKKLNRALFFISISIAVSVTASWVKIIFIGE